MATTLLPDELERVTPVLGSLARLLARGLEPGEAEFRALLLGAGLVPEPVLLAELRRWTTLLAQAREEATELTLGAIVEALMLRGLPEASAALAVATVTAAVAGAEKRSQPREAPALATSVNSLDFGVLAPGQVAQGAIEVRGGPGRVVSENSQVRVRPQQFGADSTRLFIELEPLTSGLVWSAINLVTPRETLEIPVLARWEEPQPSQGHAEPRPTLIVAPDGSGTHRSLAEALKSAAPGATIRLVRGVHFLKRGLLVQQPVTLIGEEMEATELVADEGEYVLEYQGGGLFQLVDLTVRWAGPASAVADVVAVRGGELRITRCRFAGAPSSGAYLGAGLRLSGTAHGSVRSCRMEANGSGIVIQGEAAPNLEDNGCHGNHGAGIRYAGDSGGSARANTCRGNRFDGISIEQAARPLLEANNCHGNGWSGIGCYGRSDATVRRNSCSGNHHSGVHVGEHAQPILEDNDCRENGDSGISYVGSGGGSASTNRCTTNPRYGICVAQQGEPCLDSNELRDNGDSGIAYFGLGAGTAQRNTCSGNGHYGVYVGDRTHPTLVENLCEGNAWTGLAYFGSAGGTAQRNRCSGNGKRGIYVSQRARPVLEDNVAGGNKAASLMGQQCSPSK
jgi:parallel beta-helix repeat protein